MLFGLLVTLVFTYGQSYWFTSWYLKWAILLAFISLSLATLAVKRSHWSVWLPIVSTLLSGLYVFAWRDNPYAAYDLTDLLAIKGTVAYATFSYLAFLSYFLLACSRDLSFVLVGFGALCFLDSGSVLVQWLSGTAPYHRGGLIGNASMNGCFLAVLLPLGLKILPRDWRWLGVGLVVLAILAPFKAMPLLALGGVGLTYWICLKQKRAQYLLSLVILLGVGSFGAVALGYYFISKGWAVPDSGRLSIWRVGLRWWWDSSNIWWGAGPGISQALLPYIQESSGQLAGEYFLWFHNDFIQVTVEQGLVGFVGYSVLAFWAVRRSLDRPWLTASLVGYGVCALGNYMVHLPLHAFLGFTLVAVALRKQD